MTYQHVPKVVLLWAVLSLLIPAPRAFSQLVQDKPENRERPERECAVERSGSVASERPSPTSRSTVPPITLESLPKLYGPGPTPPNATSDDLSLR
jgi:hypothetical protein